MASILAHPHSPSIDSPQESKSPAEIVAKIAGDIEAAEALVQESKQLLANTKQELADYLRQFNAFSDDEIAALVSELYWDDANIPVRLIKEGLRLKSSQAVVKIAGSHAVLGCYCEQCGTQIYASSRADRDFALRKMEERRHGGKFLLMCGNCGAAYDARRDQRQAERRDSERERLKELRWMPYREYLQTPEWQETRKAALKRAHYRCQLCNRQTRLNVHHRTYERRGCEWNQDVIALCEDCHQTFHDRLAVD